MALPELVRLLAESALPERQRQAAIACYLSASDGWRDAGELLGGAFAADSNHGPGKSGPSQTELSHGEEK